MEDQLREAFAAPIDDLYADLASEALRGGSPVDPGFRRSVGKALFAEWFNVFRDAICSSEFRASLSGEDDTESKIRDAAAVIDLISGLNEILPVASFAVIIVRRGLDRLCIDT